MSNNKNKIYTKQGDKGQTSLPGGARVSKSDIRIDAYGTLDELNSFIGLLRDSALNNHHKEVLLKIQHTIFLLESYIALNKNKPVAHIPNFNDDDIKLLETEIDNMEKDLPKLSNFTLPGGHQQSSLCHVCRTICRRAERIIISLNQSEPVDEFILKYINRLSNYFFVLSRKIIYETNSKEILWNNH